MRERDDPLFTDSDRVSSEILNDCKNSNKIWKMMKFQIMETLTSVLLTKYLQSPYGRDVRICVNKECFLIFPKDRNYEIWQRTKITRIPCRRRNDGAVSLAENLGDLITVDHKILNDNYESRNNHRYTVVMQDLSSQWHQVYPCKTKTSQKTQTSLQKFLENDRKSKVIYTDNSLEFVKSCLLESLHVYTTQIRKKWDYWKSSAQSVGRHLCFAYLRNVTDLLSDKKTSYERRFGKPFEGPIIPFDSLFEYHPITAKDQSRIHQFGKKVLSGLFLGYVLYTGANWKGDVLITGLEELETMDVSQNLLKKTQYERDDLFQRKRRIYFSNRRWTNQIPSRRSSSDNIHLDTTATNSRRKSLWFSWRIRRSFLPPVK